MKAKRHLLMAVGSLAAAGLCIAVGQSALIMWVAAAIFCVPAGVNIWIVKYLNKEGKDDNEKVQT